MRQRAHTRAIRCLRISAIAAAVVLTIPSLSAAENMSVDELVARHIEARGGSDAWKAVESIRTEGDFESFSKIDPFTRVQLKDRRFYMEYHLGGRPVTKAHDGETAWWINSMRDPGVKKIKGPDLLVAERQRDFPNPLFDAGKYELTLIGPSEIDGIETLQIDLKRPDDTSESWHLDPSTYLEVARVSPGSDFGRPMPQRTFYDDFRSVDGVMIPHYIETQWYTRNRVQHVKSVEINPELDPSIFEMPPPPGMEPWIALAGNWKVSVERTPGPGAPTTTSERSSKIEMLLGDTVMQESYESDGDEVLVSLGYDRFHEVYRRVAVDSDRGQLDVQQGAAGENGSFAFDNLETGTSLSMGGRTIHLRTTYSDLSADGFVVKTEATMDGGESWFTASTATYTR
ncbi:MAG: DUF1579 family protein [Holophagales bacterium]|nr:DUF1579 family protein [Holophagales bacterium]